MMKDQWLICDSNFICILQNNHTHIRNIYDKKNQSSPEEQLSSINLNSKYQV